MHSYEYEPKYGHYDAEEDARQMVEDWQLYYLGIEHKAKLLLDNPAAQVLACSIAEDLVGLVQMHATLDGRTELEAMLTETIGEHVLTEALKKNESILFQQVNHDGYIAIRRTLHDACGAFESLLTADAAK